MAAPNGKHEFDLCEDICEDIIGFQEKLKKERTVDDRVINVLNHTVPLKSFSGEKDHSKQCESLYNQSPTKSIVLNLGRFSAPQENKRMLFESYTARENAIKYCIDTVSGRVKYLREQRSIDADNVEVIKSLRKEQTKLRLMQTELNVEEIIKDRTLKAIHERCREHYRPPNMPRE